MPYRGFDYLSLFSDPIDFATWSQSNFASFNRIVDTKTSKIQIGPNLFKRWLENESIITFRFLRIPSLMLISKDQKENIICTMDDEPGDFLFLKQELVAGDNLKST